jgi:hypothetical protein
MKIYAATMSVRHFGIFYDVIKYFSEDKEKCEKYAQENSGDFHKMEVKEFESDTKLDVAHAEIW